MNLLLNYIIVVICLSINSLNDHLEFSGVSAYVKKSSIISKLKTTSVSFSFIKKNNREYRVKKDIVQLNRINSMKRNMIFGFDCSKYPDVAKYIYGSYINMIIISSYNYNYY
jgi:hypothetical protein